MHTPNPRLVEKPYGNSQKRPRKDKPGKKSKWVLELLAYKLKIINAELLKEHKRYYDELEYEKLSKLADIKIIKFYYFEFGLNTVCLMK